MLQREASLTRTNVHTGMSSPRGIAASGIAASPLSFAAPREVSTFAMSRSPVRFARPAQFLDATPPPPLSSERGRQGAFQHGLRLEDPAVNPSIPGVSRVSCIARVSCVSCVAPVPAIPAVDPTVSCQLRGLGPFTIDFGVGAEVLAALIDDVVQGRVGRFEVYRRVGSDIGVGILDAQNKRRSEPNPDELQPIQKGAPREPFIGQFLLNLLDALLLFLPVVTHCCLLWPPSFGEPR